MSVVPSEAESEEPGGTPLQQAGIESLRRSLRTRRRPDGTFNVSQVQVGARGPNSRTASRLQQMGMEREQATSDTWNTALKQVAEQRKQAAADQDSASTYSSRMAAKELADIEAGLDAGSDASRSDEQGHWAADRRMQAATVRELRASSMRATLARDGGARMAGRAQPQARVDALRGADRVAAHPRRERAWEVSPVAIDLRSAHTPFRTPGSNRHHEETTEEQEVAARNFNHLQNLLEEQSEEQRTIEALSGSQVYVNSTNSRTSPSILDIKIDETFISKLLWNALVDVPNWRTVCSLHRFGHGYLDMLSLLHWLEISNTHGIRQRLPRAWEEEPRAAPVEPAAPRAAAPGLPSTAAARRAEPLVPAREVAASPT